MHVQRVHHWVTHAMGICHIFYGAIGTPVMIEVHEFLMTTICMSSINLQAIALSDYQVTRN